MIPICNQELTVRFCVSYLTHRTWTRVGGVIEYLRRDTHGHRATGNWKHVRFCGLERFGQHALFERGGLCRYVASLQESSDQEVNYRQNHRERDERTFPVWSNPQRKLL